MVPEIPLGRPRVVLLDLDGTLTVPVMDFALIRREMGIPPRVPILEAMREMPEADRERASAILLHHEQHAADNAEANPGVPELIARLDALQIPRAIVTRNTLEFSTRMLRQLGLHFSVLVTREDEPVKPHPDPLFLALRRLAVDHATLNLATLNLHEVWMIGDGEHDIVAGNAAGVRTLYLSHGNPRSFPDQPSREVETVHELLCLLPE